MHISDQSSLGTGLTVLERLGADPTAEFARAVADGLRSSPPSLPFRFLYDARGSALFEQICEQPEYYLTRAEASILQAHANDIAVETGPVTLIELGSGTSVKTHYLLTAYGDNGDAVRYVPVDVSESALLIAASDIAGRHPSIEFSGIVGRYETAFPLFREHSPAMVVFLGSSIGNLTVDESNHFWQQISDSLSDGDYLLLGVDLVKDRATLEAAYNDRAGITSQFITNIFARMNAELGSDVDLDGVEHVAVYNEEKQQMEISVRFTRDQEISIEPLGETVRVSSGESVAIEISRKYVVEDLMERLAGFGFGLERAFYDDQKRFGVLLLKVGEDEGGR